MVFAEVFSGSAPLWFMDPWGIVLVLPLYWMHALLLFNLALKYKRTSVSQLYFWGVLFALYESWITKVLWAGYMGEEPFLGTFLGFAIVEFSIIGLFWHAVFAFILPILIFELAIISDRRSSNPEVLEGHNHYLRETKKNVALLLLLFVIGSLFLSMGLEMDLGTTLLASIANSLIVFLFIKSATSIGDSISMSQLELGKRGLIANCIVLGIIYVVLSILFVPDRWASPFTILLTIGFYGLVIGLLYISPKNENRLDSLDVGEKYISKSRLTWFFAIFVGLSALWCLFPPAGSLLATLIYLGLIPTGVVLFGVASYNVIKRRVRKEI